MRSALILFACLAISSQTSIAQQVTCENPLAIEKIVEAVSPGGVGDFCVQDRSQTQQVCAPEDAKIIQHNETVVAMDNALGRYEVNFSGTNCIEVRLYLHSQDHRRLGPSGWDEFPWVCGNARMLVRTQLSACLSQKKP
jgi:hypothetical protein